MTNHEALDAIHKLMDGQEWNADTLAEIAAILEKCGYSVRDMDEVNP